MRAISRGDARRRRRVSVGQGRYWFRRSNRGWTRCTSWKRVPFNLGQGFSRCTGFPCKSDCASIENRGTFTIFSARPTERAEHAIGPPTSGLRHEHGRRHVGGHDGRSLFFYLFSLPPFSFSFVDATLPLRCLACTGIF